MEIFEWNARNYSNDKTQNSMQNDMMRVMVNVSTIYLVQLLHVDGMKNKNVQI